MQIQTLHLPWAQGMRVASPWCPQQREGRQAGLGGQHPAPTAEDECFPHLAAVCSLLLVGNKAQLMSAKPHGLVKN